MGGNKNVKTLKTVKPRLVLRVMLRGWYRVVPRAGVREVSVMGAAFARRRVRNVTNMLDVFERPEDGTRRLADDDPESERLAVERRRKRKVALKSKKLRAKALIQDTDLDVDIPDHVRQRAIQAQRSVDRRSGKGRVSVLLMAAPHTAHHTWHITHTIPN